MAPTKDQLLKLFPVPGQPLSLYTARRWAGSTPESTATLRKYLQRDYVEFHGYVHSDTVFYLFI